MLLKKKRYMFDERDGNTDSLVAAVEPSSNNNKMADTREVRIEEQLKVKIGM